MLTSDDGESVTYREWRLEGDPGGGYPTYDVTARDADRIAALHGIFHKVRSGERSWAWATLTTREVTIQRTLWIEVEPCPYTHSHTRHWCGNLMCRDG